MAGGGWDDMDEEPFLIRQQHATNTDHSSSNTPAEAIPDSSSLASSKSNKSAGDSDNSLG